MIRTKNQEKQQNLEENKEESRANPRLRLIPAINLNFKFLLLPKSRIEHFQKKNPQNYYIKQIGIVNGWLKSIFTFIGVLLVLIIISIAVLGPWIAPYSFEEATGVSLNAWKPPTPSHLLGTVYAGRDNLSRIIYGTRYYLLIASLAVSISLIIGTFLGMVAGYFGKWIDSIIMRVIDIILAFPGIIFALAILAIFGSRFQNIVLILGVIGIPYYARLIRSSVFKEKELDYIAAAKVSGANKWRIMFKHILPNSIQPVIISMSFDIGRMFINLTILGFLGFYDPRFVDWGSDIFSGRGHIWDAPWATLWPSVMILFSVIGFMIVGDGLRDALDPKFQHVSY
ncbi:MAG: ABC transporter permease [Candidatus Hermodarchaeota archaeon]